MFEGLLVFAANLTNASDNIIRFFMDPYYSVLGSFTWSILFLMIGGILYIKSGKASAVVVYFIIIGVTANFVMPIQVGVLFSILGAIGATYLIYDGFMKSRA